MRLLQFFLVLQIYECSNAQNSKPRTVNLALETIFEFDNNDNSADMHVIDKIKSFLDRIRTVIDKNRSARRNLSLKDLKFTDFIRNILIILNSYDDRDLEDILNIIDEEMRKYHYKGCKFYELVENYNVRRYMAGTLETLKRTPADKIRIILDSLLAEIEEGSFDNKLQSLCDYIDSLYKGKSAEKLRKFLENLALYHQKSKRANMNIVKVIRQGIRSVLFDHYSHLDSETRRDLKIKLETFWRDLNNPDTGHHQVWEFKPKKEISNNFKIEDLDLNVDASKISNLIDKDKSKRKHGKKRKHGSKNKTSSLLRHNLEKVKIIENRFLHDSNIAIDVGKHVSSDTDFTTKKEELSIITLYPEAIIYKHPKKHSKKHKKTSESSKKPKIHKKKSHKKTNKKKPADETEKESEQQEEVKSPKKHVDLKKLVHKQESEIAAKQAEMDKLLAEHEKIKKAVEAQEASSDESSEEDVKVLKREFSANDKKRKVKTTTKMTSRYKKAKITKRKKLKKAIKAETSSEISGSEEVRKAKMNVEEARKFYKSKDSFEGIPIESNEFVKSDLRKHYTNANDSIMTNPIYNTDGFPISRPDYYRDSYPTTLTDYENGFSTIPIPKELTNKSHVETRIKQIETELQKVKEQIKVETQADYIYIPTYDKLDFWEGTTKKTNRTTTNPTTTTTKTPSTTKTTTHTTKSKTTKSKKTTTMYHTTPLTTVTTHIRTSTGIPKFRINVNATKTSKPYFRIEYTENPTRTPGKKSQENVFDSNFTNYSGPVHILDANNDINNYSKTFDANYELGFDHLDHETNITEHLAQLEEYVNTTKDNPDDKERLVRKKMLEDLKGIMDDNIPAGNYSGPRLVPTDIDSVRMSNKDLFELMDENNPL